MEFREHDIVKMRNNRLAMILTTFPIEKEVEVLDTCSGHNFVLDCGSLKLAEGYFRSGDEVEFCCTSGVSFPSGDGLSLSEIVTFVRYGSFTNEYNLNMCQVKKITGSVHVLEPYLFSLCESSTKEAINSNKNICTCSLDSLMTQGCRCGAMQREREAKL